MLAPRNRIRKALFEWYNSRLITKYFHSFRIRGHVDSVSSSRPTLYLINHSSWWDGLIIFHTYRKMSNKQHYIMMDAEGLKKYSFFGKLGAYPIDRSSGVAILKSLRYTSELFSKGHGVWLFPQGEIYHAEQRPLDIQPGAAYILQQNPEINVVLVTIYYSLCLHQKPTASLWLSEPLHDDWSQWDRQELSAMLSEQLQQQLENHRLLAIQAPDGELNGFSSLIRGSRSTSEWFDFWKRGVAWCKSLFGRSS